MNAADKHLLWNKQSGRQSWSSLSQKAYCSQQGLKPGYWRKRLRSPGETGGELIRLPISAANHSVLVTFSGLKLDVHVSALLQVLR